MKNKDGFFHHNLSNNRGYIRLVHYENSPVPFIEYKISDGFRYQGIMSKELPKYLELCAEEGYNILIAAVMFNNIPSIKLLKKNNFVFVKSFEKKQTYIWHSGFKKSQIEKMITEVLKLEEQYLK